MTTGFNAMGKPIPESRKQSAYDAATRIGVEPQSNRVELINGMVGCLESDMPYDAQSHALKFVDLTAAYVLMATLLTDTTQKA
jgi:hypothetical protein